jgi:hypothetical protein
MIFFSKNFHLFFPVGSHGVLYEASDLVTGHIIDANTGWPLYARIDIGAGPGEPV